MPKALNARLGYIRASTAATLALRIYHFSPFTILDFMDNFEDFFTATFETATLANNVVTLKGLREYSDGISTAEAMMQAIEKSREHLTEHLPWIRDTDIFDIKKRIRSWLLNERFAQGGCWLIYKNKDDEISAGPATPMAGAIMMDIKLSNRSATLSYWLCKDFTGQGLMTEAVKLLSAYAFATLKLNRLELLVSVNNDKSAAVAKHCGFTEEGVCRDFELINGKFVDYRRFSLLARDVY